MNRIRHLFAASCSMLAVLSLPADAYSPKVTKADILAAGGKCTLSGVCSLGGLTFNCRGSGYCTRIDPPR